LILKSVMQTAKDNNLVKENKWFYISTYTNE
jgi:hypothetical protein